MGVGDVQSNKDAIRTSSERGLFVYALAIKSFVAQLHLY